MELRSALSHSAMLLRRPLLDQWIRAVYRPVTTLLGSSSPPPRRVASLARFDRTLHDENEIAKFGNLSKQWWSPYGPFRPLHEMNPARVRYIVNTVVSQSKQQVTGRPLEGLRILDVGCGGGLLCESLARLGGQVRGIDLSPCNIAAARRHASFDPAIRDKVTYDVVSIQDLADTVEKDGSAYDLVCCSEVLEHVPDFPLFVSHVNRVIKSDGILVVSTINRNIISYILAIGVAEHVCGLAPRGAHDFERFITPSELKHALQSQHCCILSERGLQYNPLCGKWSLVADTSVNYIVAAQKQMPL